MMNAGAAALGTMIYLSGGADESSSVLSSVEIFNSTSKEWTSASRLNYGREAAGCVLSLNRIVLISGWSDGRDDFGQSGFLPNSEIFDPITESWIVDDISMKTPRAFAANTADPVTGDIYMIGGYNGVFLLSAERFSVASQTWIDLPPLPQFRQGAIAGVTGSSLIVAGGLDLNILQPLQTVVILNGSQWVSGPSMNAPRCFHCGGAYLGRSTFAVGGWVQFPLNFTEYYIPASPPM